MRDMLYVMYVHGVVMKVLMEVVKLQPNGRHVVSTGHNYSMPLTYGGWFEVLSEDGKGIEPLSTVAELAALWPAECVVREAVRAIVCSGIKHDNADQLGTTRLDQTRTLLAGELLALRDVVEATVETPSHGDETSSAQDGHLTHTKQYLRCVDAVGDSIFLAMNQVHTLLSCPDRAAPRALITRHATLRLPNTDILSAQSAVPRPVAVLSN